MNNYDNDYIIHNDDIYSKNIIMMTIIAKKKNPKQNGSYILSKWTHSKSFIMKKNLWNHPTTQASWVVLWPASIDGNCPEQNHKDQVCRQQHHLNVWQLQLLESEAQRLVIFMDSLW